MGTKYYVSEIEYKYMLHRVLQDKYVFKNIILQDNKNTVTIVRDKIISINGFLLFLMQGYNSRLYINLNH